MKKVSHKVINGQSETVFEGTLDECHEKINSTMTENPGRWVLPINGMGVQLLADNNDVLMRLSITFIEWTPEHSKRLI